MNATVRCPTCGAEVHWSPGSPWRPFCSERCRLIDLGQWAQERYAIPCSDDSSKPGDDGHEDDEDEAGQSKQQYNR
jgi:endogenous inhibitor of DNA gyrase (YacG/DUF329 family)